jgi:glutamate racemase
VKAIGVFDSGVGGLTVVRELLKRLPNEDIIYFGDTARLPYGIKSKPTIIRFSLENTLFLLKHNVKIIVVACNSSSSAALPFLAQHFSIPIIGVISPGAKEAVARTKNKRIGVIGTQATINSNVYQLQIKRLNPRIRVFSRACPLFVPLVEEGWFKEGITRDVARRYLLPLKKAGVDTLILGCTHYPLLKSVIRDVMGKAVSLIDSSEQVARQAEQVLAIEGMLQRKKRKSKNIFYVSDEPDAFKRLAKSFLGVDIKSVRKKEDV